MATRKRAQKNDTGITITGAIQQDGQLFRAGDEQRLLDHLDRLEPAHREHVLGRIQRSEQNPEGVEGLEDIEFLEADQDATPRTTGPTARGPKAATLTDADPTLAARRQYGERYTADELENAPEGRDRIQRAVDQGATRSFSGAAAQNASGRHGSQDPAAQGTGKDGTEATPARERSGPATKTAAKQTTRTGGSTARKTTAGGAGTGSRNRPTTVAGRQAATATRQGRGARGTTGGTERAGTPADQQGS